MSTSVLILSQTPKGRFARGFEEFLRAQFQVEVERKPYDVSPPVGMVVFAECYSKLR